MTKINKIANNLVVHQVALIALFLLINAQGILTDGDAWYTDASNHAMNGIFIIDLIRNLPLDDYLQFANEYYARYPALSLGYHPPFFPLVEAIIFAIGGISFTSARVTVLLFGMIALIYWYRLIFHLYDKKIAFFSTIFFFTTPSIIKWATIPMLELPAIAMMILTSYSFFNYLKHGHRRHIYAFLVCLGLSIMTKQTAIFLVPVLFLYLLITRNFTNQIKKEALIPIFIFAFLIIGAILMTLKFGLANIQQVTLSSNSFTGNVLPRFSLYNLMYYPQQMVNILSLPVFILDLFSVIFLTIKRRAKSDSFFILWIVCAYLMMTYIGVKEPRYAFFLIPPFCLLAALALSKVKIKKINIGLVIAIILSLIQTAEAHQAKVPYIIGYEQAAKYVAKNPKGFAVLVSIYHSGNFIFNFRKYDTNKQNIILRADKFFLQFDNNNLNELDLIQTLKDFGIKYIVIENIRREKFPYLDNIKKYLDANCFTKIKEIKIDSNIKKYRNGSIFIYELKGEVELKRTTLTLQGWRFGRKVSVPLERLKN